MSFHRMYALKGFFGDTGSEGDVTLESLLPNNAGIYYKGNAESDMDFVNFESSAEGALQEE